MWVLLMLPMWWTRAAEEGLGEGAKEGATRPQPHPKAWEKERPKPRPKAVEEMGESPARRQYGKWPKPCQRAVKI